MDYLPLSTVRPLTRLLTQTLESFLGRPSERLFSVPLDALQVAALSDQVPHHRLLKALRTRLDIDVSAATAASCSSSWAVDESAAAVGSEVSPLSLPFARRLLAALHRFPTRSTDGVYTLITGAVTVPTAWSEPVPSLRDEAITAAQRAALAASTASTDALKREVEALIVQHHVCAHCTETVSAADTATLWAILAQCREPTHRDALLATRPLAQSESVLGPEGWSAMVLSLSTAPSTTPFTSGCAQLMRDAIGSSALWTRTVSLYTSPQTTNAQRATLAASLLALSQALGEWPDTAAGVLEPSHGGSGRDVLATVNAGSLFVIFHHLHLLRQPWVPESVRTGTRAALQNDLWRVCTERDVDGVAVFLLFTFPTWPTEVRQGIQRALGCLHTAMLAQQAALQLSAVKTVLRLDTYVSVLLLAVHCNPQDALTATALEPYWIGLADQLRQSPPPSRSAEGGQGGTTPPVRVRRLRPLLATYIAIILDRTDALHTRRALSANMQEAVSVLHTACQSNLSTTVLCERGSARVLSLLLMHAPTVVSHLQLRPTILGLVDAHALTGGFTRQQLQELTGRIASEEGQGDLSVRVDEAASVLPVRAP